MILDSNFGSRYVVRNAFDGTFNMEDERPLNTLISEDSNICAHGKELLNRIIFEITKTVSYVSNRDFMKGSAFHNYKLRGDWFCIAFIHNNNNAVTVNHRQYDNNHDDSDRNIEPKWVTLISTGSRQIYECDRSSYPSLFCYNKTNVHMRLPSDTVIDCIKMYNMKNNEEIYHVFDAWVIGSKAVYKRNFLQRQEFCRVLVQGYGSKYIKFAGAMPIMQSLKRDALIKHKHELYVWFIRNKKSIEQKEKNNKITANLSQYWRPVNTKIWNSYSKKNNNLNFDKLFNNLNNIYNKQMTQLRNIQQQQQQQRR